MRGEVARRYDELAQTGAIKLDQSQRMLASELDRLCADLADRAQKSKKSALGWLFSGGAEPPPVRGIYIWGGVGRGKTWLMDIFFRAAPNVGKRRVHFHDFMGEVQERLDKARLKLVSGQVAGDPISRVAAELAETTRLLCFDELAVNDIADAMILGRLFEKLFARGVTVVATSNVPPNRLYENGLNRPLFEPFIALIEDRMTVFHLAKGQDYRLDSADADSFYITPLGPAADMRMAAQFRRMSGSEHGSPTEIISKGRRIRVSVAAKGVAQFTFAELCGSPLGAGDYLKIAEAFQTILLADVPILSATRRDEARRFITLVDEFYDHRIRLVVSAAAEPDELWQGNSGAEAFEFARTASRLVEMRSQAYWDLAGRPSAGKAVRSA